MEELLGIDNASQRSKRGPKSQLERQLEAIADLPRNQQQKILAVVGSRDRPSRHTVKTI
jgi:hypothetical protein